MIIKIEGYFFQNLITGHQCTQEELYQKYIQAKMITLNIEIYLIYFVDFIILIDCVLKMTQRLVM
ncbi:hypothetical protein X809_30150 [Paenibacillus polymyxa CR1]|nr:hypothetical protein X809_30150 [Paenibacillus polymyxa CR1]